MVGSDTSVGKILQLARSIQSQRVKLRAYYEDGGQERITTGLSRRFELNENVVRNVLITELGLEPPCNPEVIGVVGT